MTLLNKINATIKAIVNNWDIGEIKDISKMNTPSGNVHRILCSGEQTYYVKEKVSLKQIEKELQLYAALSKQGIETSVPLLNHLGQYVVEDSEKMYCLYKALSGQTYENLFDENAFSRAFLYGKSIALLHRGLKESRLDFGELIPAMNLRDQLEDWAFPTVQEKYLKDNEWFDNIKEDITVNLLTVIDQLPTQIIHRDAHPWNILLKNNDIGGFIDFDISRKGIRLFDLCYCSTAMLMSKFDDAQCREMWPILLGQLVRGYESVHPLHENEHKSIVSVLLSIQMIFTAYFFDLNNADVAETNVKGMKWIYDNKSVIERKLSNIGEEYE